MNEKGKVLAVLGLAMALEGYVLNEIALIMYRESFYSSPGTVPHSGPPLFGTIWLLLVPLGFMLVFTSIAIEIRNRYHRVDTNEIWN